MGVDRTTVGTMDPKQLMAQGYRRTSNRYGRVSRIDRPDWTKVLAGHLHCRRSLIEDELESGQWQDYYRRVISNDRLELGKTAGQEIKPSSWDPIGYVELKK